MARITVEDCLKKVQSSFALVLIAAKRAKMLIKGARPLVVSDNKPIVVALREIAAGKVLPVFAEERERLEGTQVKLLGGEVKEEEAGEGPQNEKEV